MRRICLFQENVLLDVQSTFFLHTLPIKVSSYGQWPREQHLGSDYLFRLNFKIKGVIINKNENPIADFGFLFITLRMNDQITSADILLSI